MEREKNTGNKKNRLHLGTTTIFLCTWQVSMKTGFWKSLAKSSIPAGIYLY